MAEDHVNVKASYVDLSGAYTSPLSSDTAPASVYFFITITLPSLSSFRQSTCCPA
jgi:hypothetical protein